MEDYVYYCFFFLEFDLVVNYIGILDFVDLFNIYMLNILCFMRYYIRYLVFIDE